MRQSHARTHWWRVQAIDARRLAMAQRVFRHDRQRVFVDDMPDVIAALNVRLERLNRAVSCYRINGWMERKESTL